MRVGNFSMPLALWFWCIRVTGLLSMTETFHVYQVLQGILVHQSLRSTNLPTTIKLGVETLGLCPVGGFRGLTQEHGAGTYKTFPKKKSPNY